MLVQVVKSKIHRVKVTGADLNYIGSIKALTTAFMVFSTAFGTAFFGILIDKGFTIENIAFTAVIYIVVSLFLLMIIPSFIRTLK